jgi:hypothetical protein
MKKSALMQVCKNNIIKTINTGSYELGFFSSALFLYEAVYDIVKTDGAELLAEELINDLPIYYEIVKSGFLPNNIMSQIEGNLNIVCDKYQDYSKIVVLGIESIILDILSAKFSEKEIYVIPHDERIDHDRVIANFPTNVKLVSVGDITRYGGTRSILLSYVFCQSMDSAFVYPISLRGIGPDVRYCYNQIVGLNILPPYKKYLASFEEVPSIKQFFTIQYPILSGA